LEVEISDLMRAIMVNAERKRHRVVPMIVRIAGKERGSDYPRPCDQRVA
jgi:hypothetical protein